MTLTSSPVPVLAGSRIILVPLDTVSDAELIAAADNDHMFFFMPYHRPVDAASVMLMRARFRLPDRAGWAMREVASGQVVGVTGFYGLSINREDSLEARVGQNRCVNIGPTWFSHTVWGTGLNTESKLLLLTCAFEMLGCVRVGIEASATNFRSIRAIEKLGVVREGVSRKASPDHDGTWRDMVQFSLLDTEWPDVKVVLTGRVNSLAP